MLITMAGTDPKRTTQCHEDLRVGVQRPLELCGGALGIPLRRLGVLLGSLGTLWCAKWLNSCKTNEKAVI